jgi:PEP-CTERM motif-containing protein
MKPNLNSITLSMAVAAGLAVFSISAQAQDVLVTGSLTDTSLGGGVFSYTLTLDNTGPEAVESLWLGWALSSSPVFNVMSPTSAGNNLGWNNVVDGASIQYGGASGTAIAANGGTGTFTFDSTSTPAQFMSGAAGGSVAYGVDATQFAIEDNSLHSEEFAPTVVATPEPSTFGLLAIGALGFSGAFFRKLRSC